MMVMMMMLMMMILCPKAGSLAFMPPGDEMSEVVSRCLPHRQLWVSNLSQVATQRLEVDSNPRPFGCKAKNIPLHHRVPYYIYIHRDIYMYILLTLPPESILRAYILLLISTNN